MLTSLIKINCKVQDLSGDTNISKLLIEAERGRMKEEAGGMGIRTDVCGDGK